MVHSYRPAATADASAEGGPDDGDDSSDVPYDPNLPPLDDRVISAVRSSPDRTIRPARLSSELGISVEDATAELCGLLRAVGGGEDGASFRFEEVGSDTTASDDNDGDKISRATTTTTMVFTFPPNFEARAKRFRRKNDAKQTIFSTLDIAARALKVLIAFGLIISLAVVSVASIIAMVAALVALARGGGGGGDGRHRSALMRRIRSAFFTLRQLLWCYAVFGPGLDSGGHDPFLRQTAGDLWLVLSMFCASPMSIGFWWRANMLNRRRRRWGQGWGSRHYGGGFGSDYGEEEGFSLVRQGEWGAESSSTSAASLPAMDEEGYRGLLSVVVEFLFGPSPFWPGPTESERWKLRGLAVTTLSSSPNLSSGQGLSMEELSPYAESPPASLDDSAGVVSEGLRVVSHFNGVPAAAAGKSEESGASGAIDAGKARFVFPELMAETSSGLTPSYTFDTCDDTAQSWGDMLYSKDSLDAGSKRLGSSQRRSGECPKQLYEQRHVLTKLQPKQFGQCCLLGAMNFLGIYWLRQSIGRGGLLEISNRGLFATADGVLAVLHFYAKLFFVLPLGRLGLIVACNFFISARNKRRENLAKALEE